MLKTGVDLKHMSSLLYFKCKSYQQRFIAMGDKLVLFTRNVDTMVTLHLSEFYCSYTLPNNEYIFQSDIESISHTIL